MIESPSKPSAVEIDRFDKVLLTLPDDVRRIVTTFDPSDLTEIRMVYGYPLTLAFGSQLVRCDGVESEYELMMTREHVKNCKDALGGFEDDGRAGIDGTLHRYSEVPNRFNVTLGIVVRLARAYLGSSDALAGPFTPEQVVPIVHNGGREDEVTNLDDMLGDPSFSFCTIGKPNTRKTTLLRDITRKSSIPVAEGGYGLGQFCVLVDSSNENGGFGDLPHPAIGHALRIQVGDPKYQAHKIQIAIRNLSAKRLIVDEIGYNNDVDQIQSCANLGVGVICTLHGDNVGDAIDNKTYWPLFGMVDRQTKAGKVAFRACLELHAPDRWVLYPNLSQAVSAILAGTPPMGIKIGGGW